MKNVGNTEDTASGKLGGEDGGGGSCKTREIKHETELMKKGSKDMGKGETCTSNKQMLHQWETQGHMAKFSNVSTLVFG